MLRWEFCGFNDAYTAVKGDTNNAKRNKTVTFKNNASFIYCIAKINGVKIDNAEDLDVVMPMYNLLEYSKNYRKTTGSFWNYYKDELSDTPSPYSESFKYKASITGSTYNDGAGEEGYDANKVGKNGNEAVIPLKHLSNFLGNLDIPLISCEVELILTWSKNCALADITTKDAEGDNPAIAASAGLELKITDTELYAPVVTLSKENNTKLLEQLKTVFKSTIKWNKYRSQMIVLLFNWSNIYKCQ